MKIKYTLLAISLLAFVSITHAQIKKGTTLLGGSIQYNNNKEENIGANLKEKTSTFSIQPAIGFAIKTNMVIGAQLGYNHTRSNENYRDYKANGYTGSVFLRQYWNITSKFYAFGHVEAGYGQTKGKITVPGNPYFINTTKSQIISTALIPGISYSVSKKVQLESTFLPLLSVNYSKQTFTSSTEYAGSETTQKSFSANGLLTNGQTFSLGVRFLL